MDDMYLGLVVLGTTPVFFHQSRLVQTPTDPDAPPTFRVYGPDQNTPMANGTGTMSGKIDTQTGLANYSIPVTGANGYASGKNYIVRVQYAISSAIKVAQYAFTVS